MTDGLRWQELFSGAEESLITKKDGGVANVTALKKSYWRATSEERRLALMPFLWSVIVKRGQIFGNRQLCNGAPNEGAVFTDADWNTWKMVTVRPPKAGEELIRGLGHLGETVVILVDVSLLAAQVFA